MMTLSEIATWLGLSCADNRRVSGVSIDSRRIDVGCVFVALRGERFDGHDFIAAAANAGAAAVICECLHAGIDLPQLLVPNSIKALATIATAYRKKIQCPVIALTGSNGKTTVKEMIAAILPQPSFATTGNLNNHLGVPLSVMRLLPEHGHAVFELGANHIGEIAYTVAIAQPHVALINNIAAAHIGGFGSLDGVARAKGEIYEGLPAGGTAVVNADDPYAPSWLPVLADKKIIYFSAQKETDVYAKAITFDDLGCGHFELVTPVGQRDIQLRVPGMHNVYNATAAAACSYAVGIMLNDIARGLAEFSGVKGRMTPCQGKRGAVIIDDTYNANLRSALMAVDVLAQRSGRRIFVFGDMGELGDWSQDHHTEVGTVARKLGIDCLMTYGIHSAFSTKAFGTNAAHYCDRDTLLRDLLPQLDKNVTVLVKGSRSSAMELIVQQLVEGNA